VTLCNRLKTKLFGRAYGELSFSTLVIGLYNFFYVLYCKPQRFSSGNLEKKFSGKWLTHKWKTAIKKDVVVISTYSETAAQGQY